MASPAGPRPVRAPRESVSLEIPSVAFPFQLGGAVIDRMYGRVLEAGSATPPVEIAGVLFGRMRREPGTNPVIEICDVETFEWGEEGLLQTRRRRGRIAESCKRSREGLAPVGFLRNAAEDRAALTGSGTDVAEPFLRGPYHLFLLLRRTGSDTVAGSVFVGTGEQRPHHAGPVVRFEIGPSSVSLRAAQEDAPQPVAPAAAAAVAQAFPADQLLFASHHRTFPLWPGAALALLLAGAAGGVFVVRRTPPAALGPEGLVVSEPAGLRVDADGTDIRATWNRNTALLRDAAKAVLIIRDGAEEKQIPLDLRLETGMVLYSPKTDDVEFQLRTFGKTEHSESVHVLGSGTPGIGTWASLSMPLRIGEPRSVQRATGLPATRKFVPPTVETAAPQAVSLPAPPDLAALHATPPLGFEAPPSFPVRITPPRQAPVRQPPAAPPPAAPPPAAAPPAAAPPATTETVAEVPVPPVPKHKVFPNIPRTLPTRGGSIVVLVNVNSAGKVTSAEIKSSTARNTAVEKMVATAASEWRFVPAQIHGRPVPAPVEITFNLSPQ